MSKIHKIAGAIDRLRSEHGSPNRFAVHEIANECGLSNLAAGQVLANDLSAVEAAMTVERLDREVDGKITYIAVQ